MPVDREIINWLDTFILGLTITELSVLDNWTLQSINSLQNIFLENYKAIPNKLCSSKIAGFISLLQHEIKNNNQEKINLILNSFFLLKLNFTLVLEITKVGEIKNNISPHNLKVFYIDIISLMQKFPNFSRMSNFLCLPQHAHREKKNSHVFKTIHALSSKDKISAILDKVPANMEYEKKIVLIKESLLQFIHKQNKSISQLAETMSELLTEKFDYLRRDKSLFSTLTGSFSRNQIWTAILAAFKQRTLEIIKLQVMDKKVINEETWGLARALIGDKNLNTTGGPSDHSLEVLHSLHQVYLAQREMIDTH